MELACGVGVDMVAILVERGLGCRLNSKACLDTYTYLVLWLTWPSVGREPINVVTDSRCSTERAATLPNWAVDADSGPHVDFGCQGVDESRA